MAAILTTAVMSQRNRAMQRVVVCFRFWWP